MMVWIAWVVFVVAVIRLGVLRWRQAGDRARRDIDSMMRCTNAADRARGRPLTYPGIGE